MSTLQTINIKHPSASTPTITFISSTNQATINAGSASAPVLSFIGDENTGLWSPAADTVAFSTGGTERMRITSAGNVGIGTSSPARALDVVGSEQLQSFDNSNSASSIAFYKSRGSSSAPTVVQANDFLASQTFWGYDGSTYRAGAAIYAQVDGTPGDSDMPGRLQFLTTTDGSASLTERMRINNAGLITGTGTSLGAWTAYTPTLGGTGWAIGNGTETGYYCQIGKVVYFIATITFGSTSTYGAGACEVAYPSTSSTRAIYLATAEANDTSTGIKYPLHGIRTSTTNIQLRSLNASNQWATMTSTTPFTWTSGDILRVQGTYEAA